MRAAGEIIVVSGPPGSGKTTVADSIANLTERGVHLETDWFYRSIRSGLIAPHLPAAQVQNTAVVDVATAAAATYAQAGYCVFLDGVVGPWFLDRVARRLQKLAIPLHYLILRTDRETTLARIRDRENTNDTSGAEIMWDQFADLGEFENHVIADGSVDELVARSMTQIQRGELRIDASSWIDDRWPVSVKGVLAWNDEVIVLQNDRDEWELPGGRLERNDPSLEYALQREFREELNLGVQVGALVDSWIYDVAGKRVLIVVYRCSAAEPAELRHSHEHQAVSTFGLTELAAEKIPDGYLRSISLALQGENPMRG